MREISSANSLSVKLIRRKMTRNLVLPPRRQHVIIVDTFSSDVIFIREREQDFSSLGNISTELFTGETHFTEGDSPQMTGRSKFHPAAREQISFVSRNFPWLCYLSGKSFAPFRITIFIHHYFPEKYSKFWNFWKYFYPSHSSYVAEFYLEFLPLRTFFPRLKKRSMLIKFETRLADSFFQSENLEQKKENYKSFHKNIRNTIRIL